MGGAWLYEGSEQQSLTWTGQLGGLLGKGAFDHPLDSLFLKLWTTQSEVDSHVAVLCSLLG